MKKLLALLLTAMILTVPALAAVPEIEHIEYEGNNFIEIDFRGDVSYDNPVVAVRDFSGTEYAVTVYERDDDDLTFRAENLVPGETYEITISGIRAGRSGEYGTVSGQITVPAADMPAVQRIEYDRGDRELEIEFVQKVDFENLQVEVTDLTGTVCETRIIETDNDSIDLRVDGLTVGETYLAKISGVSLRDQGVFQSIAADFVAVDD